MSGVDPDIRYWLMVMFLVSFLLHPSLLCRFGEEVVKSVLGGHRVDRAVLMRIDNRLPLDHFVKQTFFYGDFHASC